MDNIKVSVITVVYNGVDTIERTINSVLEQTYTNLEYIIIDGQSTDGTLAVIDKYRDRIMHVISGPDKGMYEAMNKGITLATGELIGIINSDDWYEKDAISHVVAAFLTNSAATIFHGILKYWSADGYFKSVHGHEAGFLKFGMIEHPTCFVKRTLYQELGLFDLRYNYSSDYDFMLRARAHQAIFFFIPHVLANFSEGGVSSSFKSTRETLIIQRRYKLINVIKHYRRLIYWRLKQR